ncbi:MAG: cell division ATP-binding protein FtsE [Deltaproteobacteria bacterium]|nr:cell division ATP-binding protein FtsE [Deltaproteobacteria bacterium]
MIQLYHITKAFDKGAPALSDITVKIEKGEFVFFTGPSGAGKSTLLKIIFGAESPTSGQLIIDGRNYVRIPPGEIPLLRRRMGFVFQDFKLIPSKTVFENVALSLRVMGMSHPDIRKRVFRMLAYLKIQHRAGFFPLQLSGGEQQRVAIARALVKEPAIVLADEPTGNLDPALSMEIMELFKDAGSRGTTVIIATHDRAIIERIGKRTVALEAGRVAG